MTVSTINQTAQTVVTVELQSLTSQADILKALKQVRDLSSFLKRTEKSLVSKLGTWNGKPVSIGDGLYGVRDEVDVPKVKNVRKFYGSLNEDEKEDFCDVVSVSLPKARDLWGESRVEELEGIRNQKEKKIRFTKEVQG